MKKIIVILIFGVAFTLNAQTNKVKNLTIEEKADRQTARMKKALNLTESQIPLVRDANLKILRENEEITVEIQVKRKALNDAQNRKKELDILHKKEIQAILTPSQISLSDSLNVRKVKKPSK